MRARIVTCVAIAVTICAFARTSLADDDDATVFAAGVAALDQGKATEAIASFEALADRGVVNPVASFDRGLAYAARARIAETPGDLGRAAHGFEEARELTHDPSLATDASRALIAVRSEVARRRARSGEPVEVEQGRSLGQTVSSIFTSDTWAILALVADVILFLALFTRWRAKDRARLGASIAIGISTPVLILSAVGAVGARHAAEIREGIIVAESARPFDARHIVINGGAPISEGSRLQMLDESSGFTHVRLAHGDAWIPSSSIRALASPAN